jgi:hypothetical protein
MNRREFTASLAAAIAAPALPLSAMAPASAAPVALPSGTYLWAEFIAKARGHVDAGFLARRLQLSPMQAAQVMQDLVSNGAVRSAGLTGMAEATKPFRFPTQTSRSASAQLLDKLQETAEPTSPIDNPDKFTQIKDVTATPDTSSGQPTLNEVETEDDNLSLDTSGHGHPGDDARSQS